MQNVLFTHQTDACSILQGHCYLIYYTRDCVSALFRYVSVLIPSQSGTELHMQQSVES